MERRRYMAFLVLSIMMLAFTWACGGGETTPEGGNASPAATPAASTTAPVASTPAAGGDTNAAKAAISKEDAQKLFLGRCKACHSEDGKGNKAIAPEVPDFTSAPWHDKKQDKELYDSIANGKGSGKGTMPKWNGLLKPEEMQGLVEYVRSLKK